MARAQRQTQKPIGMKILMVVLVAVNVGLIAVLWSRHTQQQNVSDQIFNMPGSDGRPKFALLPNLNRAVVVLPDRPHNLDEVQDVALREDFRRRRQFEVSTNGVGLRSPDPEQGSSTPTPVKPPSAAHRIVCIGASITFGWGVPFEDSYPAQLADILDGEVINAGAVAAKPQMMAEWASANLRSYEADLVILNLRQPYLEDDPIAALEQVVDTVVQAARPAPVAVVLPPLSTFDLQIQDIIRHYPPTGGVQGGDDDVVSGAISRSVEATIAALSPLRVLPLTPVFRAAQAETSTAEPGTTPVVLQWTDREQRLLALPGRAVFKSFTAPDNGLARGLVDAFEQDRGLVEPYFFDGGHPDAAGYRLYAETVAKWIEEQGWLNGREPAETVGAQP